MPCRKRRIFSRSGPICWLVWIGFGTLVGLLAKAILPGKDPGGAFATVVNRRTRQHHRRRRPGVLFGQPPRFTAERARFVVAILGTSLILVTYRILNGSGFKFGMPGFGKMRRKRRISVVEDK